MNHSVNSEISTSLSLLSRVRRLDVAAWERFSHLYGPLVYSWARRSGLQDSDSCDVTQEVFAVLASQLERYDQTRAGATFRGWLWGIVRNKLREHHRRTATEPHATGGTDAQILWSQQEPKATAPMPREVTEALANRALQLIRSDQIFRNRPGKSSGGWRWSATSQPTWPPNWESPWRLSTRQSVEC
jgi:RNA polymerase sigma-70 factor, ECF subfamily